MAAAVVTKWRLEPSSVLTFWNVMPRAMTASGWSCLEGQDFNKQR